MSDTPIRVSTIDEKRMLSTKGLPRELCVLGKTFSVYILQDDEDPKDEGSMCIDTQVISVRPKENVEQVQDTVLHESIHAIDYSLDLKLSERQVHNLAAGILALFKDNPQLSKWILKKS